MRLAPVAIRWRSDAATARRMAGAQAALTHAAAEAIEAAERLAAPLVAALGGAPAVRIVPESVAAAPRAAISSAPRAVDTLEAALWCVARSSDFETALLAAVNLGGDTDTIGAVTGQLAGALYGAASIPARWRHGVSAAERLTLLASRLHDTAD